MNQLELEYARKKKGKSKEDMAAAIGKSVISYSKKLQRKFLHQLFTAKPPQCPLKICSQCRITFL